MTTETTQQSEHTPLEKPLGRCMGWHCSEERPNLLARVKRLEDACHAALYELKGCDSLTIDETLAKIRAALSEGE